MSAPTLASLTLDQPEFSGFAYPVRAMTVPLLAPLPTAVGNAVIQSSALLLRVATLSWYATSTSDKDTALGFHHDLSQQTYTDFDGTAFTVIVSEFTANMLFDDLWECRATLIEVA